MPTLTFRKKKLSPPAHIYAIKQSGGNHIERVLAGGTITFRRAGDDNNWGFVITFSRISGGAAPATITLAEDLSNGSGPSSFYWTFPGNVGTFKYQVSFPYDNTRPNPGHVVEELDPIIIIDPPFVKPKPKP
jgi:hypothetical protein